MARMAGGRPVIARSVLAGLVLFAGMTTGALLGLLVLAVVAELVS
jgi:hypothetical protein